MHTPRQHSHNVKTFVARTQRREMHLPETSSFAMLKDMGVPVSESEDPESRDYFLTVSFDRDSYTPCIVTSHSIGGESAHLHGKSYPLGCDKHVSESTFNSIARDLKCANESVESLSKILGSLIEIFFKKEATSLSTRLSRNLAGEMAVARSSFSFDDAAHRSNRHGDIKALRDSKDEVAEEVEAEKDGIVYIK